MSQQRVVARVRRRSVVRTKDRFTLWLEPETHLALKSLARQRRMAISALAEDFIRAGLGLVAQERLEGPALPAVRQVVQEITNGQTERLAKLVARGLVEVGIDRRLTYALLNNQAGGDTARAIFTAAETAAVDSLKRRLDEEER